MGLQKSEILDDGGVVGDTGDDCGERTLGTLSFGSRVSLPRTISIAAHASVLLFSVTAQ